MDERGATLLCDSIRPAGGDPAASRYLILLRGGTPGAMYPLDASPMLVGRDGENAIVLASQTVSRRHARIEVDADGRTILTDLGSTNGTYRNGEKLRPGAAVALADGDRIGFGPTIVAKFARPDPCEERFQRELYDRAVRDPLTGLFNRGYFLEQAPLLTRRAAGRGLGLAVLVLDIDHFKRVNDTLGHAAGDLVLREVAAAIRQATRSEDLVARFGGEEFLIALPIAAPELAAERAERIRKLLAARHIAAGGKSLRVTASIGLAFAPPEPPRPLVELLGAADVALYEAKAAGRDRIVCRHGAALDDAPRTTVDFVIPELRTTEQA